MTKRLPFAALALALLAIVALPGPAHAYAVAGDTRHAFIATTAFLTLLPLGMIGAAGLWLRHRLRERDGRESFSDPRKQG